MEPGRTATRPRFLHEGKLYSYKGSVFDKLQDASLFTGTHKHRFDSMGRGRGAHGRDSTSVHAERIAGHDTTSKWWGETLRAQFYGAPAVAPVNPRLPTENVPKLPESVPAPRFEEWVLDSNGHLVCDEQRTYSMNYGPHSGIPPALEQSEYHSVSNLNVSQPTRGLLFHQSDLEERPAHSVSHRVRDFPGDSFLPVGGDASAERAFAPLPARFNVREDYPPRVDAPRRDYDDDGRGWISDSQSRVAPTVEELLAAVEHYERASKPSFTVSW